MLYADCKACRPRVHPKGEPFVPFFMDFDYRKTHARTHQGPHHHIRQVVLARRYPQNSFQGRCR